MDASKSERIEVLCSVNIVSTLALLFSSFISYSCFFPPYYPFSMHPCSLPFALRHACCLFCRLSKKLNVSHLHLIQLTCILIVESSSTEKQKNGKSKGYNFILFFHVFGGWMSPQKRTQNKKEERWKRGRTCFRISHPFQKHAFVYPPRLIGGLDTQTRFSLLLRLYSSFNLHPFLPALVHTQIKQHLGKENILRLTCSSFLSFFLPLSSLPLSFPLSLFCLQSLLCFFH